MARFNLDNYVTVDERIRRFYEKHPDDGAILTRIEAVDEKHVTIHATVTRAGGVWAQGMARLALNSEKALEKCETTAIGRALANAGFVKEGEERPSREEMEDVQPPKKRPAATNSPLTVLKREAVEHCEGDVARAKVLFEAVMSEYGYAPDEFPSDVEIPRMVDWMKLQ